VFFVHYSGCEVNAHRSAEKNTYGLGGGDGRGLGVGACLGAVVGVAVGVGDGVPPPPLGVTHTSSKKKKEGGLKNMNCRSALAPGVTLVKVNCVYPKAL